MSSFVTYTNGLPIKLDIPKHVVKYYEIRKKKN